MLCLFSDLQSARDFESEQVAPALPPIPNDPVIFGVQKIMDAEDRVIGEDSRYLITATTISMDDLPALMESYGGVAVPAHIDKATKSLVGNFGMVGDYMGFKSFELSRRVADYFIESTPGLGNRPYRYIHNSDAHYLQDIGEHSGENLLELPSNSAEMLIDYLKNKEI